MRFDIHRECEPASTFRVASIKGRFDLSAEKVREHFEGEIVGLDRPWQIGVIFGHSGTGKSTIARETWPAEFIEGFEYGAASVLDDMPKAASVDEISRAFMAVGFASTPSWLKPYSVLSQGERMRVDIARSLLEDRRLIVFDEFTSVVDRDVAQVSSLAIAKAIRRSAPARQFIAVTCHEDVLPWLDPDWIFDTNRMQGSCRPFPFSDHESRWRSALAGMGVKRGPFSRSITI